LLRRLLDSQWTYFGLAGVLFVVLVLTQFELKTPRRPAGGIEDIRALAQRDDVNVLFVLIDTLRGDRLHASGYPRETSPMMDYLAHTGVRFSRVVSQSSWTKSSMASMWTATWPRKNGVLRWNHALSPDARTPAEVLKEAGFRTAGIWRNGWVGSNFGFGQGFDTYLRAMPVNTPAKFKRSTPSASALQGTDEDLTVAAQEFLRTYRNNRFFLYLHYMDVHQYAYDENSALFGTGYSDTYDNAIRWVDTNLAVVVKELQDLEIWDRTLIVVASDHGEGFREHGLEGHAKTLYGEVVYVPWILAFPFELEPGLVIDETVGNVDIWPTLYALLGLEAPQAVDGRSLVPLIEAAAGGTPWSEPPRPYYSDIDRRWGRPTLDPEPLVAVTLGDVRLLQPLDETLARSSEKDPAELYDRAEDPGEKQDLVAAGDGDLPPELRQAIDAYLAIEPGSASWGKPPEVVLEEMELNQLRALGYVIK
jgi:arylsulfatase A-like enzyme